MDEDSRLLALPEITTEVPTPANERSLVVWQEISRGEDRVELPTVPDGGCWKRSNTYDRKSDDTRIIEYRCSMYHRLRCKCKVREVLDQRVRSYLLEKNFFGQHQHDLRDDKSKGVPVSCQLQMMEMIRRGENPGRRALLRHLLHTTDVSANALNTMDSNIKRWYKRRIRTQLQKTTPRSKSMEHQQILSFCREHFYKPIAEDFQDATTSEVTQHTCKQKEPTFVLAYHSNPSNGRIAVVFTTIYLFQNLDRQGSCGLGLFIQTDAT